MSQEASQTSFNLRLVEEENLCWDQCPSANSSCDSSPAFETQEIQTNLCYEGNAINSGEQSNSASHMKELSKVSIRSIWFSLIACDDKAELALPQIPKRYIHTKHGNLPVSYIGKYLATKLNLKHESEVEILCFGQPLLPNLSLQNLVEIWAQATANGEKALISTGEGTCDGSSFVMELTYRRSEEHV